MKVNLTCFNPIKFCLNKSAWDTRCESLTPHHMQIFAYLVLTRVIFIHKIWIIDSHWLYSMACAVGIVCSMSLQKGYVFGVILLLLLLRSTDCPNSSQKPAPLKSKQSCLTIMCMVYYLASFSSRAEWLVSHTALLVMLISISWSVQ